MFFAEEGQPDTLSMYVLFLKSGFTVLPDAAGHPAYLRHCHRALSQDGC